MQQIASTVRESLSEDDAYAALLSRLDVAFSLRPGPVFTTDADGLYDAFLGALAPELRQRYTCRTCRHFVDRFGGIVTIDSDGMASSPLWDGWEPPAVFSGAVLALSRLVSKARVTGVFLSSEAVWGNASNSSPKSPTGVWLHMHSRSNSPFRRGALLTAEQAMAEKREDHATLCRALDEFSIETVRQAHHLLTLGGLFRSDKCIGVAKWLLDLHEALDGAPTKAMARNNVIRSRLIWRAVALAAPGFCHVRSTMIGTLLEDLAARKDFAEIKRAFDAKMSPLAYQRPQAAPTDGQLAAAEKVVEKLASAGSLERRFATIDDIAADAVWMPKGKVEAPKEGVFGHLRSSRREPSTLDVPAQVITWDKFWRTVLPEAERVESEVGYVGSFFAFVTAAQADAPPILQWDREGARNPVSWYVYPGGSTASQWSLAPGWAEVLAITTQPSSWGGGAEHQGNGVYFVLAGARDTRKSGIGLFPEILKAEYHAIRAAIEAYSRSRELGGGDAEALASGVACQKSNGAWSCTVRVTSRGARALYKLDRWD
jgi:hypothetical protein